MVVKAAKRTTQNAATRTARKPVTRKKPASASKPTRPASGKPTPAARRGKVVTQQSKTEEQPAPKKPAVINGRVAAPAVRLGMTPPEVRATTGHPDCIVFGPDDHVEWQFGARGFDVVGAPTLYVTALTFTSGRVVRITERMSEALP